jgi:hypothetical protein
VVAERYRLVGQLGRGGMGCVWAARDELLGREVAVKELVLPAGMAPDDVRELGERAIREARAIARLDHRNVVRIFDVVFADGRPWIVMELVPSRSLYEVVSSDGPMPPEEAARIGLGVLAALRAAHRAGILHRDVKPANVLLGHHGRVVLTDFGLATAVGDSSMTSTGIVLGSPSYLAPERTAEGEIGPAADLWSLGATLYAAVEGKPPYAKSSPMATLTALATEPPRPAAQAGVLGPVLAALLEKDPARRADAETAERLLRQAATARPWAAEQEEVTGDRAAVGPTRQLRQVAARTQGTQSAAELIQTPTAQPDDTLATTVRPAPNRTNRRLLIAAVVITILAAGIAARPAITSALADDTPPPPTATSAAVPPAPLGTSAAARPTPTKKSPTSLKPLAATNAPHRPGRQIQNFQTGTCLYAPGTTGEVKLWACATIDPQLFSFAADGTMRVRGKCVAIAGPDNGAHLQLSGCDGSAGEQFSYNTSYDLVSGEADRCVDVPDGNTANGVPVQIWDCTGAGNQKWHY